MPYAFPVKVCEASLPQEVPAGFFTFGGKALPRITQTPASVALVGDTGLRVKPKNLGTCSKPGPDKLYGVKQCRLENIVPFDAKLVEGSYQDVSEWPLKDQLDSALARAPDLVLHVGDYLYRQGPCARNKGCVSINNATDPGLPGEWGDNWHGWYSDFFEPSLDLLAAAPWIVLRGNHETCDRGGHGFFLFLDPRPLPSNWTAAYCLDYTETYGVPFAKEQFIVVDDSAVDDLDIDHVCPSGQASQSDAWPASRHDDPKQSPQEIAEQIAHFAEEFRKVEDRALPTRTNFLATHHPLLGVACHKGKYFTVDWTMQQALRTSTLSLISATIHGHVHWFQGLVYENHALPVEIVVGNGGTKLDPHRMVNATALEGLRVRGVRVERAFTSNSFGYSVLGRKADGDYLLQAFQVGSRSDDALRVDAEHLAWSALIPAASRRVAGSRLPSSEVVV